MASASYNASKVIGIARPLLVFLGKETMKHQTKIKIALSKMPLCESYLREIGVVNPRPEWIEDLGIDVGRFARGEADYDDNIIINSMAPQHKSRRLSDLLHWWVGSVITAGEAFGETHGVMGRSV